MDKAEIVIAVLKSRAGFDDWWDNIDPDIRAEILVEILEALGEV